MIQLELGPDVEGRVRIGLLTLEGVSVRASDPGLDGVSGRYFADRKEKQPQPHASDPALAQQLWAISEGLTGFHYPA